MIDKYGKMIDKYHLKMNLIFNNLLLRFFTYFILIFFYYYFFCLF